jgi:solute carrier family 25 (mitochondrial aspartate/glutamate transporter), member 12/13
MHLNQNFKFLRFDRENDGSISATDFYHIMTTVKGHLLTEFTRNNLIAAAGGSSSAHKVIYHPVQGS